MGPDNFVSYLETLDQTEYLLTHKERYIYTYEAFQVHLERAEYVCELGGMSPITAYLRESGIATVSEITSDLRLPWPNEDKTFDVVAAFEVIEHIHDQPNSNHDELVSFTGSGIRNVFSEAARILRPNGVFLVTTPNASSVDVMANVATRRHPFQYPPHVREYTVEDVLELGRIAGFNSEFVDTWFAWNNYQSITRDTFMRVLAELNFDTRLRGDDAVFVFRKQGYD